MMHRRELLKRIGLLAGGAVVLPSVLIADNGDWAFSDQLDYSKVKVFNKKQRKLVAALAEAILPRTSTPGATDAKVGPFIELMLQDCYKPEDIAAFIAGLNAVDALAMSGHANPFVKLTSEQQTMVLTQTEADAKTEKKARSLAKKSGEPQIFWDMLKSLTLTGFFTSEVGAQQAANYMMTPGRWDGAAPVTAETRSWAT